jgi:PAS domain-containing protein
MNPGTEKNKALEQALARAGDGAIAIGPDGRVVVWNRAAERILGWSAREVLGRACCGVLAGGDGRGNSFCYEGYEVMGQVRLGEPVELTLYRLLGAHLLVVVLLEDLVVAPQHVFASRVEPQALDQHPPEEGNRDDGERRQSLQYAVCAGRLRSSHRPYHTNHVAHPRVTC